jgi:hypothetical protein
MDPLIALARGSWRGRERAARALINSPPQPEALFALLAASADDHTAAWAAVVLLGMPHALVETGVGRAAAQAGVVVEPWEDALEVWVGERVRSPEVPEETRAVLARTWASDPPAGTDPAWMLTHCLHDHLDGAGVWWGHGWWSIGRFDASQEPAALQSLARLGLEPPTVGSPNPAPSHVHFGFVEVVVAGCVAHLSRIGPFATLVRADEGRTRVEQALADAGYLLLAGVSLQRTVRGLHASLIGPAKEHTLARLLFPIIAS